jgi:hypothetical protein
MPLSLFFSVGSFSRRLARRSTFGRAAPSRQRAITWKIGPMESHDQAITLAGKWMVRTKIAADGIGQILNVSIIFFNIKTTFIYQL